MSSRIPMACPSPRAAVVYCWLSVALVGPAAVARAQPAAAQAAADWKQFEASQELTDYRLALREGSFDDATKAFLTNSALPQLGLPANRGGIERVRRRMRELLCGDAATDPKALDAALQTIVGFMTAASRNDKVEPIVRINSLLFVGEVKGKDGKPWPAAAAPLAAAVGDPKLPLPLRIVAAEGLARHVEAAGPAAAPTAGPVLVKLLPSLPQISDRAGADWLAARALAMVTELGTAAPPDAAPPAIAILEDASRPTRLRARAAVAAAAAGAKADGIDWGKVVAACRATALTALETEKARGKPAAASAGSTLAYRRVAWELMTLAEALTGPDGRGGIAAIRGGDPQEAAALGGTLREAATMIDTNPDETAILDVLAMLTGRPAPAAREPAAADSEAQPAADGSEPVVNPFGQ
ncbi:MAG: hypothetical protein ACKOOF_07990 [Planctomycetaceae bacterium]